MKIRLLGNGLWLYYIETPLTVKGEAPEKHSELTLSEVRWQERNRNPGGRIIGGDKADLYFDGYTVKDGYTELYNPVLWTGLQLTDEEVHDIAADIVGQAFESIGFECLY